MLEAPSAGRRRLQTTNDCGSHWPTSCPRTIAIARTIPRWLGEAWIPVSDSHKRQWRSPVHEQPIASVEGPGATTRSRPHSAAASFRHKGLFARRHSRGSMSRIRLAHRQVAGLDAGRRGPPRQGRARRYGTWLVIQSIVTPPSTIVFLSVALTTSEPISVWGAYYVRPHQARSRYSGGGVVSLLRVRTTSCGSARAKAQPTPTFMAPVHQSVPSPLRTLAAGNSFARLSLAPVLSTRRRPPPR